MYVRSLSVIVIVLLASKASADSFEGNLRVLYRSLEKCNEKGNDLGTCLRVKAVTLLDRALVSEAPVVINDFLSLTPDKDAVQNETSRSESEISHNLSTDPVKKDAQLDELIADKMSRFLQSRSLQFTVPADIVEGRKKGKKGGPLIMAALAMGGMMIQMAMGKIALLAGKALLIGKMALLLSAVIGLKKLVGGGGGESHPQVVYASEGHGGGHGGWGRSYDRIAHELAYHAQARSQ